MTAQEQVQRIESLYARWKAAPYGSKQRRHLRRAYLRAVAQAKA